MKTFFKFLTEKRVSTSSEFDGFNPLQEELPQLVKAQNYKHQQEIENYQNLREAYIAKEIFDIGTIIQDVNTGMVGEIIRRGTNYLICVTKENVMFKSWIKDLNEQTKIKPVTKTGAYGVSANKREVGTSSHRKYAQSMVPGQEEIKNFNIREFINKYRKK